MAFGVNVSNVGKALSLGYIRRYPCSKKMKGGKDEGREVQLKGLSMKPLVRLDRIAGHVVGVMITEYICHLTRSAKFGL